MKSFKTLREDALKKVQVGKVFEPTSSNDNKKDSAFSKKGKVATGDEGQLKYGSKNNDVHVTEEVDLDQKYADWQDEVKQRNPQHAAKIKFKTNPDQRDTISAEHGDRSFGTFNTKTGEAIHLGEATEGNKFESAYDVVAHLAKAGYRGIQAKDVELYQGGRATARHRGSSASQHYGKYFSVNAAGVVKVHGDGASAAKAMKEEVDLDEAVKLGSKVSIHAPGKSYHGKTGIVGEVRHGLYKGAPKTYTVDYDYDDTGRSKSIQLDKKNIKLQKEEVELNEAKVATFSTKDYNGYEYNFNVFNKDGKHSYQIKGKHANFHPNVAFKSGAGGDRDTEAHAKKVVDLVAAGKHKEALSHLNTHGKTNWVQTHKESFELEEDYGYENRTAKDAHLTYTQYMRKYYPSKYKGMWESEDCRVCGQTPCNCTFINESYYNISGIVNNKKFNVKLNPTKHYGNQVAQQNSHLSNDEADAVGRHLDHPKSETQDRTSEYNGHVVSTKISDVGINEDYKEKNYEYKNKDGRTATLSCATYSDGDAEHFVHIKGQRATRHSTKEKAHQSLRVRGYEPTGKVEEE